MAQFWLEHRNRNEQFSTHIPAWDNTLSSWNKIRFTNWNAGNMGHSGKVVNISCWRLIDLSFSPTLEAALNQLCCKWSLTIHAMELKVSRQDASHIILLGKIGSKKHCDLNTYQVYGLTSSGKHLTLVLGTKIKYQTLMNQFGISPTDGSEWSKRNPTVSGCCLIREAEISSSV